MASTADQRRDFGEELRRRRLDRGLTAGQLGEALSGVIADGDSWSHAAVTAWERGKWAPRSRMIVDALEQILDVDDGDLVRRLGYSVNGADMSLSERVSRLEDRFDEVDRRLDQVLRALEARER